MAVSPKGAMGLMQLMPATATEFGVQNPVPSRAEHQRRRGVPEAPARALRQQGRTGPRGVQRGPGNVEKYGDVPPFRETQSYVKRVTGAAPAAPPNAIYKWMELVDGRPVTRYSNAPPKSGAYEIVGARR